MLNLVTHFIFDGFEGKKIDAKRFGLNLIKSIGSTLLSSFVVTKPLKLFLGKTNKIASSISTIKQFTTNPLNASINFFKKAISTGSKFSNTVFKINKVAGIMQRVLNGSNSIVNLVRTGDIRSLMPVINLGLNKLKNTFKSEKLKNFFGDKKLNFAEIGALKHKKINEIKNPSFDKNIIFLNSSWIYGLKIIPDNDNTQKLDILTYFILFRKETTNSKLMIKREGSRLFYENEIEQFLSSPSAGRFYLNNISWGHDFTQTIKENEENGNRAYLDLATFEGIEKIENIKKTINYSTSLDFSTYQKREAYWRGRKFGNYLLRGYKVKDRRHQELIKVAYRRENWQQKHLKQNTWTSKGKTVFSSSIITQKPKKL